ncbi:Snf7-domain-containing protein [Aspergillus oleicola]
MLETSSTRRQHAVTMGNTNSSHKISSQDRAILDMKNQRDRLHQYQKRITVLTDRETAIAKECLARDDRKRALLALRRKKYQESLLAKTDAQLAQLEQLTSQVEFALVQKDVMFGLQQGTQVLQTIHKEMGGIEGVEKLMGETEEARAYQEEISSMLAGHLSNQDEDEVEDELEALHREVQGPVKLPDAPTAPPEVEETPEEEPVKQKARAKARARERTAVPA